MANSKESLLLKLKGRANTRGWGAIVSYNRTKVNLLLAQQHITRFNTNSFLPAFRGNIQLEGDDRLELSNITLSAPRLSFENASLKDSKARLHMGIVGGTVTRTSRTPGWPSRVVSSFNIFEQHGYVLDANINLRQVVGSITQDSEVVLDISQATELTTNLISDNVSAWLIGDFFQKKFAALPAELQVYSLGTLKLGADDLLAPQDFYILTQAAPEGKNPRSDSYGDGAVVLFVRTKNNFYDGTLPSNENDFPYLIPDDKVPGGSKSQYSGSLLISRQAVMHWFVEPHIRNYVGRGLSFEVKDAGPTGDYRLVAQSGQYSVPPIDVIRDDEFHRYHFIRNDLSFSFNGLALVIRPDYRLALEWHGRSTEAFHYWDAIDFVWDVHKDINVDFEYNLSIVFNTSLNPKNNTVNFVQSQDSTFSAQVTLFDPESLYLSLIKAARAALTEIMNQLLNLFRNINIPEINFFAINHLLFPQHNALILKEAWMPGDLTLFGEIDPTLTSFSLKPLDTRIKIGERLQFEIVELRHRANAANIQWGVRNIDGSRAQGDITPTGLYTAPSLGLLQDQSTRNIVTATFTDPQTQETLTSSAMVVVVATAMAITPALYAMDLRHTPRPVTFRASTLSGNPLCWAALSPDQGTLIGNGNEATYTPPAVRPAARFTGVNVEVIDTVTGESCVGLTLLINGLLPISVEPAFHPGLAPSASVRLSVTAGLDSAQGVTWSVPMGNGSIDAEGKFTAPDTITFPYSVVQCDYTNPLGTQSGYSVLHLSEIAPRSKWSTLSDFTVKEQSGSKILFANGLQQVKLRVHVRTYNEDGDEFDDEDNPFSLSPSELSSMRLIIASSGDELPYVTASGVPDNDPDGRKWGVDDEEGTYKYYPSSPTTVQAVDDNGKFLYIQTRSATPEEIAVALTRADNVIFKSTDDNGSEEKDNIIRITPQPQPTYNEQAYTFGHTRVENGHTLPDGSDDNDNYLNTVDYYILRLNEQAQNIKFVSLEFEGRTSMVQWESRQHAEQVGSYTGYAFSGGRTLIFEPLLMQSITEAARPNINIAADKAPPPGTVLISLHRRMDFTFTNNTPFERALKVKLIDEFGNAHRLSVKFKSPTDRNELLIETEN